MIDARFQLRVLLLLFMSFLYWLWLKRMHFLPYLKRSALDPSKAIETWYEPIRTAGNWQTWKAVITISNLLSNYTFIDIKTRIIGQCIFLFRLCTNEKNTIIVNIILLFLEHSYPIVYTPIYPNLSAHLCLTILISPTLLTLYTLTNVLWLR
jgi:hypothetical protein